MQAQQAGRRRRRDVRTPARRTSDKVVAAGASALAVAVAAAGVVLVMAHLSEADASGHHGLAGSAGAGAGSHAGHAQAASTVYEVRGVQLTVQSAAWMSHDMFGGPAPAQNNFPMPAQMMPGMESDDVNRLHVEMNVTNRSGAIASLVRRSFAVESPEGKRWAANPGNPDTASLLVGASMSLDLYFDVPLQETVANILFTDAGSLVRIPFQGAAPQHQHGY